MPSMPVFDVTTRMGRLMAEKDWSATPLGHQDTWPAALRIAVRALLATHEPRSISWGPSLCLLYNDPYADMMDERHPSALGRPLAEVWAELWPTLEPYVRNALDGQSTFRANVPLSRLSNGVLQQSWHTFAYSPVFDSEGRIGGVQCLSLNMTESVSREQLREGELRRMRQMFEHAPGFVAVVRGRDYVFELANDAFEQLVQRDGLMGVAARELLPELATQGYFELLDQVRLTGRPFSGTGMPVHFAAAGTQRERYVDFVFQPIHEANEGAIDRIFIQGIDVTERERALASLRDESRRKDQFLAILAHEVRNPLTPILTTGNLLSMGRFGGDESRKAGDLIKRQALHISRIVEDLLDASRASRGTLLLSRSAVDVSSVLAAATEQVMPRASEKRVVIDVRAPTEPVTVLGDPARLTQIVANLIGNAIKFSEAGGRIEVTLQAAGDCAELAVSDTGVGIAADAMERIFEIFVQGDDGAATPDTGLGIGLALVRSLVELHGGTVVAYSRGRGQGAEFRVRLPLHVEASASVRESGAIDAVDAID